MKVFISADIEGVSGVVNTSQTSAGKQGDYDRMRERMTLEVAAACEGAIGAGADEIVVADGHGAMTNIIHEKLPRIVRLVQGSLRPAGMMEGLHEGYKACIFVGYHSARNVGNGVLNHSMSGKTIYSIEINGHVAGEVGLNAMYAGALGVPVVMLTGDEAACEEAAVLIRGIKTVSVKRGIGSVSAESIHPELAYERIKSAAKEALTDERVVQPLICKEPVEFRVTFVRSGMADAAMMLPGAVRKDGATVIYEAGSYLKAYRGFYAMLMLSSTFSLD